MSRDWIPITDRLPEIRQPVALASATRFENCDFDRPVQACGYLEDYGNGIFWSVRYGPVLAIEAFTHWFPLPLLNGQGS